MKLCKYFKEILAFWRIKVTSSNISIIIALSKIALWSFPFPFQLKTTKNVVKFIPCTSKWQSFLNSLAWLTLFFHLFMMFNWIRLHRSGNEDQYPYWKHIMMGYYFVIFICGTIGLLHFTWVKDQTIYLLNSNIETEIACQNQGNNVLKKTFWKTV